MYSIEYNVDGTMMNMSDITGDVFDSWKLCREKLFYMYGHNYSGGRHSVSMLALYAMNDLPLTASETGDLEAAQHEQNIRYGEMMDRKENKRNRKADY